jgi:hypothetical protein
MASLVRRLQIRHLKRQGFRRTKFVFVRQPDGQLEPRRVTKGGLILNPKGEFIGTRWPQRIPALG